jgi:hypothetical protein
VLHRHRALWAEPDAFDPNHFLDGARERIDRFAYLPFGVGPHVAWPVHRVTLRPCGGLPMIVRRRWQ